MKKILKLYLVVFIFTTISISNTIAQNSNLEYQVDLSSYVSTKNTLPFWLVSNTYGAVPNSDNLLINASLFSDFKNSTDKFEFSYKASLIGFTKKNNNELFVNELYASLKYNKLQLDLGVKHPEVLFEGLS